LLQNIKTEAIIGPQKSTQAAIVSEIGNKSQVPVISFSATSPALSSMNVPYFVRTTINDIAQVTTITSLIKAYGWREVVLICDDDDFGRGIIPYLADGLQEINVKFSYHSLIPISSTEDEIQNELFKLQTMRTRVFIVHMSSSLGSILFLNAKKLGMMSEGYVWIMTNGVTNMIGSFNPSVNSAMRGALGVRLYVPKTTELDNFTTRWKKRFQEDCPQEIYSEPSIYALWAYDTIHALAMAVEDAKSNNIKSATPSMTSDITLNVFPNGPQLLKVLSNITFQGLSGNFVLVNGQLQYTAFEIINVVGQGIREIGYWRGKQGFSKQVDASKNYSTYPEDLNPVIWPGESIKVPNGWEIPNRRRKLVVGEINSSSPDSGTLRVGVIKSSYTEFMEVETDTVTKKAKPRGYTVDVFVEAMKRLPNYQYEFELFADLSQDTSLHYDDFVYQVKLGVSIS
jgi:glutamate receptor, ionotropic, plant